MWSTRQELEAVLAQAGLGEWSPRLAAAARHAIVLEPGPVEEGADAPIGASRVGGMPDLPSGVPWPWRHYKGLCAPPWPLSFVAQIDFAEILAAGGLEGFPTSGRLLFFYDPAEWPWGETIEDQAGASVMFLTDQVDHLGRRGFPVELSNPRHRDLEPWRFMFRPRRLTPKLFLLPPPWRSRELLALDGVPPPLVRSYPRCWEHPEGETVKAYSRFWQDLAAEHRHLRVEADAMIQVGGIPFAWQNPVETDCVKYADDDYLSHPTERATHFARADSWQLVLQFDDGFVGEYNSDHRFSVCNRKTDLAEGRFDRCWTVMQCT